MTTTTEKLVNALNNERGLSYPDVGYLMYQDVRGDGRNIRSLYSIINADGGVVYSQHNASTARKRCKNLREAIHANGLQLDNKG